MHKKIIYIKGMHCVSCEKLLDSEFRDIAGTKDVKVDRLNNTAEFFFEEKEPDFSEIKKIAKKFGYDAFEKKPQTGEIKGGWQSWVKSFLIVAVILFFYRTVQNTGFLDKLGVQSSEISYGIAFVIGLVASISSCLAVVGAVVIAFAEKYKTHGGNFFERAVRPNIFFHIGRLATFFVLGGILGLIGGEVSISGNAVSILTIFVAIVMGWLGLNILGILPSISEFGVRMPKALTGRWRNLKDSEHAAAPFLLGGMTFFLPCGFTQSMQIFALASGSFWTGGLTLFLFALGTLPVLLVFGVATSWTKSKKMLVFQKVAGMLVLLFALYTFNSGMALSGVKTPVLNSSDKAGEKNASIKNETLSNVEEQTVEMHINRTGFSPNVLRIKKGAPVKWVVKGDQVTSCTNKIIVPSLNLSKNVSFGENVIRFTPEKSGEIPFSCWMGMVRGKFIVE